MKQDENSKQPKIGPLRTGGLPFHEKMAILVELRRKEQLKQRKELDRKLAEQQLKSNKSKGSSN